MKQIISLFFILFSCIEISAWELKRDSEGIQVFTRPIEGSQLREFKAVSVYNGSLKSIVAVLRDPDAACSWFPDCKEFRLLKVNSPFSSVGYMRIKAPFPVSDRDNITQTVLSQDKKSRAVRISITGIPKYIGETSGVVRVTKVQGYWLFTPKSENETEIVYQVHAEPGGSLPDMIANSFVTESPFKALKNLKNKAKEEKYQNADMSKIIE